VAGNSRIKSQRACTCCRGEWLRTRFVRGCASVCHVCRPASQSVSQLVRRHSVHSQSVSLSTSSSVSQPVNQLVSQTVS
jgi:hypothetical protein